MCQRRSHQAIFQYLQVVLCVALSLEITIPFALSQLDPIVAQTLKKRKIVPPPPSPPARGFPGNRTVSASMSNSSCDLNLVALAPFDKNTQAQIPEHSVWGQTSVERPTLWFFVPATPPSTSLEFSLQNRQGEDIYRSPIQTPQQVGIIGVSIPSNKAALQLDRDYHWTLKAKVACGTATSNRVYVDGWIKRVSLPSASDSIVEQGIWYDAVTNLARQRAQKPNDRQLQQDWIDLLQSANLETIAKQPILN
ncbi:DUF928 domain-containing protein [Chamaesiphon sp. GL140_3_metabinner_50]|uniref:DUF928 domain-containing protein n=1 Tax=Chamaesiphon sp. GL140_3_metabinner_50 TaxID=2970812 RepID=UPI0025F7DF73|nr:DUF928 domain-containing protein [Chamaesiphon sp. GL140_3_metabinner_50]